MFTPRNVQLSVYNWTSSQFTAPQHIPGTSTDYVVTYNVYGEDAFRTATQTDVEPYIYLLMNRVPPKAEKLPTIILDFPALPYIPYEIGTRGGSSQLVNMHIFGRNRGERDDLAGYLAQVMIDYPNINIYDYSTTPATLKFGTFAENISIAPQTVGEENLSIEGSLVNWNVLQFELLIRAM